MKGRMSMKAVYAEKNEIHVGERPEPILKDGEVLVRIQAASVNRRDLYTPNRLAKDAAPLILGSDATGIIEQVSADIESWQVGDEVIINPSLRWFDNTPAPPEDFEILSLPDQGTFAEKIAISAEQIERKPDYLSIEEAATIGIAPLTGYRALFTKGQLQKGQTVFIPGGSSGVATFMIQFAKNIGARVITSSRSEEKREKVRQLGVDLVIDTAEDWNAVLQHETVDLVIDSVGAATFNRSLAVLKKGGTLVTFGATTADETTINLRDFFYGQYTLHGTTMGSREEFRACLSFMEAHHIRPIVEQTYAIEHATQAFQQLQESTQFGKIVLTM